MRFLRIQIDHLTKKYKSRTADKKAFEAVSDACMEIDPKETLGLLGESGSGKSTLGQMLVGLVKPSAGRILWDGEPVHFPLKGENRRKIQILFQHPEISFNPVLPLISSMREPYRLCGKDAGEATILKDLERFGLHREHLYRTPRELSGGELQRAALSRILVLEPELIVLDEPTSMLDVISQAQIIHFLMQYQKEHGTSYLFITHNPKLADMVCSRIYEMHEGRLA